MEAIKLTTSEAVQQVIDGNESALEVYAWLKNLQKHLESCIKEIEEIALDEAEKHDKTFTQGNYIFERRIGRKVYSFKNIPEWVNANKSVKDIEDLAKKAYAMYEKGTHPVDAETGEVLALPEVKTTRDVLIIKPI